MDWFCFGCFRWINDTVCPNCLTEAPESAKDEIISELSKPKPTYEERQIQWYRLKMTGRKK